MNKAEGTITKKIGRFLRTHYVLLLFLTLLAVGMYLRFWNIANTFEYGWDQARDAWKVRDILTGTLVLNGPRTGVGHFNLGPIWYYYLAPFYMLTRLDPIAAQYGNIIVNIFNFLLFFWVTTKVFGSKFALVATYMYTVSGYLIEINRTPWNVSPVLGVSVLIFYCIHEIVIHQKYRLTLLLMFLTGLFLHLHFAFVFLPPIILLSLLFAKDKKKVVLWGFYGLPLFVLWTLPLVFLDIEWKGGNTNMFQSFLKDYFIDGFHLRFFMIRIHDAFIQYQQVLAIPHTMAWAKFIIPVIFVFVTLTERGKILIRNILILFWFFVPAVVYSFYAGTTSEYYALLNAPMVIYSVVYLIQKLYRIKIIPRYLFLMIMIIVFGYYTYKTSGNQWVKAGYGGLEKQKEETRKCIQGGCTKEYNEGFIDSYLYSIWTDPKYKNYPF